MNNNPIKPRKAKNSNKWSIAYRVPGYQKTFYESFNTLEEAQLRSAEIRVERMKGTLSPPRKDEIGKKYQTLKEYLEEYVTVYGSTHWGDSQYSSAERSLRNYVFPAPIASLHLKDLRTSDLDKFYYKLLFTPEVTRTGHRDKGKTVGISVVEKVHSILRAALNQAVRWGYIDRNPALSASVPKVEHNPRAVWTPEQAQIAIDACENENLRVCILMGIACSMRIGEILGLTWDDISITEESLKNNSSTVSISKELKRCEKNSLKATDKLQKIYLVFPEFAGESRESHTSLVLKVPKTHSSIRTVYIPNTVAKALLHLKESQEKDKTFAGNSYQDFGLVIAQPDGRPTEERYIAKGFAKLIERAKLPKVVFHSLRHLSTSMKLRLSRGDIKAVQGDTGHSQADMVTQVYSHTFDDNRKVLASLMESSFFDPDRGIVSGTDEKTQTIINSLQSNPELADVFLGIINIKKTG